MRMSNACVRCIFFFNTKGVLHYVSVSLKSLFFSFILRLAAVINLYLTVGNV